MRVSTAEFISRVGEYSDQAEREPVTITVDGRDRLVLVSADEYARLKELGQSVSDIHYSGRNDDAKLMEAGGELPELWGALRGTMTHVGVDIAESTGEVWDAER